MKVEIACYEDVQMAPVSKQRQHSTYVFIYRGSVQFMKSQGNETSNAEMQNRENQGQFEYFLISFTIMQAQKKNF